MNGKIFKLFSLLSGLCLLWTTEAFPVPSVTIQGGGMKRDVYLGMTKRDLILKLGAPDIIKSEGYCFTYDVFDLSVILDKDMRVERIYLGKDFQGVIKRTSGEEIRFEDILKLTSVSVQDGTGEKEISVGMSKEQIIGILGQPDNISNKGETLRYDHFDITLDLDPDMRVERIYLDKDFKGIVRGTSKKGKSLAGVFGEVGRPQTTLRRTDEPSPLLQNRATVELENKVCQPREKEDVPFPLEYRGQKKLYELHSHGIVMKYKYVLDDEGVSFYLDHNKNLYATVLYTPCKKAIVEEKEEKLEKICLEMIHFDFDRYNIKPQYIPILNRYVQYLKENEKAFIVIQGHTDAKGTDSYNRGLSMRRARSVYNYFVKKGIDPSQLKPEGLGESTPIAPNETPDGQDNPDGRAINRRAQFQVFKPVQ